MCQVLHTRNSGGEGFLTLQQTSASVSDKEAERVQHTPTPDDALIATEGCRWRHRQQLWHSCTTSITCNTHKIVIIS